MNRSHAVKPPLPEGLTPAEREAFDLYDSESAHCNAAGWMLVIRVCGFAPERFIVLELRRGYRKDVRKTREWATWWVTKGLWTQTDVGPVPCTDANRARELIRSAMAAFHNRPKKLHVEKVPRSAAKCHLRGRGLKYLTQNVHDRDS